MKKLVFFLLLTVSLVSSCSTGVYLPNAYNNYGIQTQVILDRANFRIVQDVEVVIEVNNTSLKRRDVEKSAYGELLNRYKLTGSQAIINVSIEEVRRESTNWFTSLTKHKQYVAARATIIEFIQENGEPIKTANMHQGSSIESQLSTEAEQQELADEVLAFAYNTLTKVNKETDKSFSIYQRPLKALYYSTKATPSSAAISDLKSITSLIDSIITKRTICDELVKGLKKPESIEKHIQLLVDYANKEGF